MLELYEHEGTTNLICKDEGGGKAFTLKTGIPVEEGDSIKVAAESFLS